MSGGRSPRHAHPHQFATGVKDAAAPRPIRRRTVVEAPGARVGRGARGLRPGPDALLHLFGEPLIRTSLSPLLLISAVGRSGGPVLPAGAPKPEVPCPGLEGQGWQGRGVARAAGRRIAATPAGSRVAKK